MTKRISILLYAFIAFLTMAEAQENMINGHEYVDLGLPSGTLWATCNVGANSPKEYGDYFAWGETTPKEFYSWGTYKWCNGTSNSLTKYCFDGKWGTVDRYIELVHEDDAAHVNWGNGWRMPSADQIRELIKYCNWEWTFIDNISGCKFVSTINGNSLFFPAAGWYIDTSIEKAGAYGTYASRSIYGYNPAHNYKLYIHFEGSFGWGCSNEFRFLGQSIRPVVAPKIVEHIVLNETSLSLTTGETFQLQTTVSPSDAGRKNVTWETTNANVATVSSSGLVTAVAAGKCSITATSDDGSNVTASCAITVAPKLPLNSEKFPDANFRAALAEILGISEGDEITDAMIQQMVVLYVNGKSIADLTGVEHFIALKLLYCHENLLTSLDVSQNTALTQLRCSDNQLTTLDVSKNTILTGLNCSNNQLTTLDVSKNTALTELYCGGNQLPSLDVSKNTALTRLDCYENQLTALGVSKNTALKNLVCYDNQMTALDVSQNTALTALVCFSNRIKGAAMDALVASLPTVTKANFFVINMMDESESNVCTKAQVGIAKEKGWKVYDYNGGNRLEYEGSDPVEEDIDPVDEDDNIDFGSDMDENDDLNGNVIGDIYYNINTGNGGYNAAEGCIVVTKPTDDGTVNDLEGKDIFGEDFKSQFTGIVFKVPAGKGTIKVNAETTGNMLLKVKIGSNDPVEMELNGKLKVTFPYNVSETTYVYIYAGAANEAKGFGTTNDAEDAALKIYGIEFERGETTAIDASLNDNGQRTNDSWYTIDGKKLSGEPTKKGIYI